MSVRATLCETDTRKFTPHGTAVAVDFTAAVLHALVDYLVGVNNVGVSYQKQQPKRLSLVVVHGKGPPLLGRNWLKHFTLDWGRIKTVL